MKRDADLQRLRRLRGRGRGREQAAAQDAEDAEPEPSSHPIISCCNTPDSAASKTPRSTRCSAAGGRSRQEPASRTDASPHRRAPSCRPITGGALRRTARCRAACPVRAPESRAATPAQTDRALKSGAILPWAKSSSPYYTQTLQALGKFYKFTLDTKWKDLPKRAQTAILHGSGDDEIRFAYDDGMRKYETRTVSYT